MTTEMTNHVCPCGRALELVDASRYSRTTACPACRRCMLIVAHPDFELSISLADFHLRRGDFPGRRPLTDLAVATRLVDCLARDEWLSPAASVDFGVDTPEHHGALRHAVRAGIGAYELDRVLGDGPAITQLVRGIPGQPFKCVEFRTAYDDFACLLGEGDG